MSAVERLKKKALLYWFLYWILSVLLWVLVAVGWIGFLHQLDFQAQFPDPNDSFPFWVLTAMIAWSLGQVLVQFWGIWITTSGARATRNLLHKSDLAMQLASGTLLESGLFNNPPWPMHLFFKIPKETSFQDLVEHVASFLNWYLEPSKQKFKLWVFLPLFLLVFIILLVFGTMPLIVTLLLGYFVANMIWIPWLHVQNIEFARYLQQLIEA